MILSDEGTWPAEVVRYLDAHRELFWTWEAQRRSDAEPLGNEQARRLAHEYDVAVDGLRSMLLPFTLHGYHCTRLTEAEIAHILACGMRPPDRAFLCERIDQLRVTGMIDEDIANRLKEQNQAHESSRAGMIWFCFFPPRIAGQDGIERFFRSWGGEALYNSHERDPLTGRILTVIGVPCLVEVDVPIASFPRYTFLDERFYRQFLINRGFETSEPCEHEDRGTWSIPPVNVRRIIRFSDPEFAALTDCNGWIPPLR
jgi:hypothetical protein